MVYNQPIGQSTSSTKDNTDFYTEVAISGADFYTEVAISGARPSFWWEDDEMGFCVHP